MSESRQLPGAVRPARDGDDRVYYFLDREFEDHCSAPVLRFPITQWPGSAPANIELYCAMDEDSLRPQRFSIGPSSQTLAVDGAELTVTSARGESGTTTYKIAEKHLDGSADYPLSIQLEPEPHQITRTFYDADHSAEHVFQYRSDVASVTLKVLSRSEIGNPANGGVGPVELKDIDLD